MESSRGHQRSSAAVSCNQGLGAWDMARYQVTDPGLSQGHREGGAVLSTCGPGRAVKYLSGSPHCPTCFVRRKTLWRGLGTSHVNPCFVTLREILQPSFSHLNGNEQE